MSLGGAKAGIEPKDLDAVNTKSEICEALKSQLGLELVSKANELGLRKAYGDTQIAPISLSTGAVKKSQMVRTRPLCKEL